jgi:hypothetical protein
MSDRATGKDVILAILDNMRESAEPLLYQILVPSHYDVYLHREDHERLSGIFPRIREEARRALGEQLVQISKKSSPHFPGFKPKGPKVEAAEKDWYIKLLVDEDDELAPGDILVDSRLTLPAAAEYGVGSKTQRTVETVRSGGETKKLRRRQEELSPEGAVALAKLTYQDKDGQRHEYPITKPEISVGRGGRAEYCDLELDAPPDVSRQHFYLRQDPETRDFFVQDVSKFGTSVNGQKLTPKEWIRIPSRAAIKLADKISIEFESL